MRLTVESPVRASCSQAWTAVSTVGGINREVAPFLRMTDPTHGAPFDAESWRVGAPVLWQPGLGFIPFDRQRVELVVLPDGEAFVNPHRVGGTVSGGTNEPCSTIPMAASSAMTYTSNRESEYSIR